MKISKIFHLKHMVSNRNLSFITRRSIISGKIVPIYHWCNLIHQNNQIYLRNCILLTLNPPALPAGPPGLAFFLPVTGSTSISPPANTSSKFSNSSARPNFLWNNDHKNIQIYTNNQEEERMNGRNCKNFYTLKIEVDKLMYSWKFWLILLKYTSLNFSILTFFYDTYQIYHTQEMRI